MAQPTPEIKAEVKALCEGWQDSNAFIRLHGVVQACLVMAVVNASNIGQRDLAELTEQLRVDAADIRVSADGLAQFLEHLAERVEAKSN